ncbi:MAG: DUF1848 domain-containing protein [Anaerorhabdus sp.]
MIINTGNRTDIPAYYSEWFYNRIKEGYVLVRNPYYRSQVIKYRLSPDVVDVMCFCTKNPKPMLKRLNEIKNFRQFWFVTITPYGKEIEPNVPNVQDVLEATIELSKEVGSNAVGWRYDPIFLSEQYTIDFHIEQFSAMVAQLRSHIQFCVISFIDLYGNTTRNFKGINSVNELDQKYLVEKFVEIANANNLEIYTCCENKELGKLGVNISGCMTKPIIEKAINCTLDIPKSRKSSRSACDCLLGNDIGMYNTCNHGCLYCYANYDMKIVSENITKHNKTSPLLIGELEKDDIIKESKQISYFDGQLKLF